MTDGTPPPPYRVLVANDSPTARAALRYGIETAPDMVVVGEAEDGIEAALQVHELKPHVVVMDVVMPNLDGYSATRRIMNESPTPIVIMSEKVGVSDDAIFEALSAGALYAVDALPSPAEPTYRVRCAALHELLRTMAGARPPEVDHVARRDAPTESPASRVDAIGIAASAGGPQAIRCVLESLPLGTMPPIFVVQHLSPGFTHGFAEWLGGVTSHAVRIAVDGERARRGVVYLAPDDHHLSVGPTLRVEARSGPPVGGFRPAATVLFRSMARLKDRAIGIILTGMGEDGADGALEMTRAGGSFAAQDEASSAVYGMPRAVVKNGATDIILPLERIGDWILEECASS